MAADGGYGAKIGFDSTVSDRKTGVGMRLGWLVVH